MRMLAVALVLAACRGEPASQAVPAAATSALPTDARETEVRPTYVGVVIASSSVDVTPRIPGVITRVDVAVGDTVSTGQVVVEMDSVQLREELRGAEAALGAAVAARQQAQIDIADAKRKLAQETTDFAQGIRAKVMVEDAAFALERAKAAADKAIASEAVEISRVQTAKEHVEDTQLRARFDGTVAMRYRDAGNRVDANTPIIRIVGTGGMRLRFAIAADGAHDIAVGKQVAGSIDSITQPVHATVANIAPTIDSASGMVIVDAQLSESLPELRGGLGARVYFLF